MPRPVVCSPAPGFYEARRMEEYEQYDGIGLAELVHKGEVRPEELLEAAITRIDRYDRLLSAVVTPMFDTARAAIQAGLPAGPFRGVPFLLKDLALAAVPGLPTRQGAVLFQDFIPEYEAEIVARYRRAGCVFIGKTATPELGLALTTESRLYRSTQNPWALGYSPGGSSGGAAAAVSAGYVPAANASDGGGSIRIPAAWCGLFGLKPTRARTPSGPVQGIGWAGLECVHALTRSVRDSAALLDATQGADVGAPFVAPPPVRPYLQEAQTPPGRLRIGIRAEPFTFNGPLHPDCQTALEDAVQLCTELGHILDNFSYDIEWERVRTATRLIVATDVRVTLEQRAHELGRRLHETEVEPDTWRLVEVSQTVSGADYLRALHTLYQTGRQFAHAMQGYDVVMTPTVPMPPVALGLMSPSTLEGLTERRQAPAFTQIANIAGNPAMSVPLCWNDAGLPIGIQFIGHYGDESVLFRLAGQLEQARPWYGRRPPLSRVPDKKTC
jgi:Asp-tRNA(Asn)/Glu-tRNA(Gln) amidotransferase A subunit family amidase